MKYAQRTEVPVERSEGEIKKILLRYGATSYLSGQQHDKALIAFEMRGRRLRFVLPLPSLQAEEFRRTPAGRRQRSDADQFRAWEQACRQRWRALALAIKAKLEAVETEITTFEEEFLAHIVLPNGETVADWMTPQIEHAYKTKKMPALLDLRG